MNWLAKNCSHEDGCTEIVAEKVIEIFLEDVAEALSQGNIADLGVFSTLLREAYLAENSIGRQKTVGIRREKEKAATAAKVDTFPLKPSCWSKAAQVCRISRRLLSYEECDIKGRTYDR